MGSAVPSWCWFLLLIAIGLVVLAALIYRSCWGDSKKKGRRRRKQQSRDVEVPERVESGDRVESVPLMQAPPNPMVGVQAPPPQGSMQFMPGMQVMQPMQPMQQMQPMMQMQIVQPMRP